MHTDDALNILIFVIALSLHRGLHLNLQFTVCIVMPSARCFHNFSAEVPMNHQAEAEAIPSCQYVILILI